MIFENGVPFAEVLRFIYSYESVDALSREDFFRRHYLLFFLKGGKHMNIIRKLKSLHQVYGSVLSNSILEYFEGDGQKLSTLCNVLVGSAISASTAYRSCAVDDAMFTLQVTIAMFVAQYTRITLFFNSQ